MILYKFAHPRGTVKVYRERGGEMKMVLMGVKREAFCSILVNRVCHLLSKHYHKAFTPLRIEIANWNANAHTLRQIDLHALHLRLCLLPSVESSFEPELTPGIEVKVHLEMGDVIMFRVFHTGTVNSHKASTMASMFEAWVCIRDSVLLDQCDTTGLTAKGLNHKMSIVDDPPVGTPVGTPIGTPVGSPVGTPVGSPVGSPFGSLFGPPVGSPAGSPVGTPLGSPFSSLFGSPDLQLTAAGSPEGRGDRVGPLAHCSTATFFECVWDIATP